jgi:DNA-directed RNA polymerase subunit D
MSFLLSNSMPSFANALRRLMTTEVPVMAVDYVDFENNSTGLYDEVVSHRIGMIPLKFNRKNYTLKSECSCKGKGCGKCQAVLSFDSQKKHRKNAEESMAVLSGDLTSDDDDVFPVSNDVPIVEMLEGQELKFDAVAILGIGKDHAKWQAANVGYFYAPSVKISSEKCKKCGVCSQVCPKGVFDPKTFTVKRADNCSLCMRCVDVCEQNAVSVRGDETSFVFTVESVSGLTPKEILHDALEILETKAKEFLKDMK